MKGKDLTPEFIKDRQLKSFVKVGQTFVDIKQTIGFSFIDNPEGYIIVQFVYESGRAMNAFLRDRDEFSQFLLEIDTFIDDPAALISINKFIDDIELTVKPYLNMDPEPVRKARRQRKNKETE